MSQSTKITQTKFKDYIYQFKIDIMFDGFGQNELVTEKTEARMEWKVKVRLIKADKTGELT